MKLRLPELGYLGPNWVFKSCKNLILWVHVHDWCNLWFGKYCDKTQFTFTKNTDKPHYDFETYFKHLNEGNWTRPYEFSSMLLHVSIQLWKTSKFLLFYFINRKAYLLNFYRYFFSIARGRRTKYLHYTHFSTWLIAICRLKRIIKGNLILRNFSHV